MTTQLFRRWVALALIVLTGFNVVAAARADSITPTVTLAWVDSQIFPTVTAYFTVSDANGLPVVGLSNGDLGVQEDGVPVPAEAWQVSSDTGQGLNLVLALDLSMEADAFAKLQTATKAFIDTLGQQDKAAIVAYYNEAITVQDFTASKDILKAAVDSLTIRRNSTSFNAGAVQAVNLAATLQVGRKAVIMLTDSGDNFGKVAASEPITRAQAAKIPIYTVGFGLRLKADELRAMALQTGGQPFTVLSPDEVRGSLQTLSVVLRQGYKVTYRSSLNADNVEHRLAITVKYLGQAGKAESSFVATPSRVTLSGPGLTEGQTVIGKVQLTTQVKAPAEVATVVYWLDGQPLISVFTPPDYTFQWDSASVAPGPHTLTVKTVDAAGNEGEATVNFTVALPMPLSVTVTASQTDVRLGAPLTLEAYPTSEGKITRVDFLLDDELLGSDGTEPYSFVLNTGNYKIGSHLVTVKAEDDLGGTAQATLTFKLAAVPGRGWLSFFLFGAAIVVILAVISYGLGHLRAIVKSQATGFQKTCQLEINNEGNIRTRYELKADDPLGALKFQFMLNGVDLAKPPDLPPPPLAALPAPAPRNGRSAAQASRGEKAAKGSGLKAAGGRAYASSSILANILGTVGYMLPRSMGDPLVKASMGMRQAQTNTDRMRDVSRDANQLKTAASGKGAPTSYSTPSQSEPAADTALAVTASRSVAGVATGPVGPITPVTPPVAPGEVVMVQLVVDPIGIPKAKEYIFRVITKALDVGETTEIIEQGSIKIARRPFYLRLLPWLAFIPLALVAVWVGQFGLMLMGWLK